MQPVLFDANARHFDLCKGYRAALTASVQWWLSDGIRSVNKLVW